MACPAPTSRSSGGRSAVITTSGILASRASTTAGMRFAAAVPVSGLVVTKLDGTARGGIVVAVHEAIDVPVKFLSVGEAVDDLVTFDAADFSHDLLGEE